MRQLVVVTFQSKLVSVLLKARIVLDLDQCYNIDQINPFFNFLLSLEQKKKITKKTQLK